jgi:DNA-binding HxlR family transcriptional regulator
MPDEKTTRAKRSAPPRSRAGDHASKPATSERSRHPIMALLELLGRRWVLRILWELREGPLTFRALQSAASDVSPSVLNQRLAELREVGLIELSEQGYALSDQAMELAPNLLELDAWARRHHFRGTES